LGTFQFNAGTTGNVLVRSDGANGYAVADAVRWIQATAPQVPPAPTGLTATAGNTQVSLNWATSSGATSYNVKSATVNGGPYTTIATGITATSYTNSGLTN